MDDESTLTKKPHEMVIEELQKKFGEVKQMSMSADNTAKTITNSAIDEEQRATNEHSQEKQSLESAQKEHDEAKKKLNDAQIKKDKQLEKEAYAAADAALKLVKKQEEAENRAEQKRLKAEEQGTINLSTGY